MSTQTDITGFLDLQAFQEAVIPLEPEHFDRAVAHSRPLTPERHQWRLYIQELALCGFLSWLTARATGALIEPESGRTTFEDSLPFDGVSYLRINGFTVCLLATESVAQETVTLPRTAIATAEAVVHLYVLLEVQEEQEQVILRGCLRADQLLSRIVPTANTAYVLPLDWFDPDANHLLFYLRFLAPASITIPVTAASAPSPAIAALNRTIINVWNWSQTLVETTTQTFSWSMPQPLTPAFALRRSPTKVEAAFQDLRRRQQLDIPEQAQYSYATLTGTPFQLGAVSWLLPGERSQLEWALLLLVVAQPGQVLPLGTTLQVATPTGLAAVTLETPELYLYLLLEGSQAEAFTPTLRSPHLAPVILPAFVCRPPAAS